MSPSTPEGPAPWRWPARWPRPFSQPRPLLLRADSAWDGHAAWPDFEHWCRAHAHQPCALWLSAPLVHELPCEPGLPLADDRAVLAWARPLLLHYHGPAAEGWALAAWQQGRRRGVSALHGVALDTLRGTAARHGVQLRAVRPWWSLVLRLALRRHAPLRRGAARVLVLEGDRVVLLGLHDGRLQALEVRCLDDASPQALARWVQDTGVGPVPWVLGYGLQGPAPSNVQAPEQLDVPAPGPQWLGTAS